MIKRTVKIIATVLSAAIFVICLTSFVIIAISAKNDTVPSVFNHSVLTLLTKSMEPVYKAGDVVVVKKVNEHDLQVGDVISFYSSAPDIKGMPNTHRVIRIETVNGKTVFWTKGDNNEMADIYGVESKDLIGKVVFKVPAVGKAVRYIQTKKAAYFLIIIVPILVIFFFEIKNVKEKFKQVKEGEAKEETEKKE